MLSKAFIVCVLDERIVFISPDFNLNEYPCLYLKTPLNYLITIIWMHGLE